MEGGRGGRRKVGISGVGLVVVLWKQISEGGRLQDGEIKAVDGVECGIREGAGVKEGDLFPGI